jgi:hypothetical protein
VPNSKGRISSMAALCFMDSQLEQPEPCTITRTSAGRTAARLASGSLVKVADLERLGDQKGKSVCVCVLV